MRQPISFAAYLKLPEDEVKALQTPQDYSGWNIWTEENLRTTNVNIKEDLSANAHKKKMGDLEKALKQKDWWWFMSDSGPDYKKGKSEEDKIKAMRDVLGDEGKSLYRKYAIKAGVINEGKKDMKPVSEYEVFLQMKMREWEIKSLEELEAQLLKKFWQEVDAEWKGNPEVKVNLPEEKRGLFPDMDVVQRQGTLGYGDDRKVGEKSLTAGSFCDAGNLYPEHLVPKWTAPSPQRKRGWFE